MMPSVGLPEILLIGALALIVVGPKDLPLLMRRVGKMVGQAKRLAREFTSTFEELGRQAELEELRKEVEALKRETTADIEKDLQRTTREIDDAMRAVPNAAAETGKLAQTELNAASADAAAASTGRVAPAQPSAPAPAIHPAAAQRPAGPRIEQPAAQPRPRPEPAPQTVKTE